MILSLGIIDIISTGQSDTSIEFAFLTALLPHNLCFSPHVCRTICVFRRIFSALFAFFTALSPHILNIFTALAPHNLVLLPSAVPHYSAKIIALKSCPCLRPILYIFSCLLRTETLLWYSESLIGWSESLIAEPEYNHYYMKACMNWQKS